VNLVAKLSTKGLVAIALFFSLITAALVYNFLRESAKKPLPSDMATVVVARSDIPPKTRITPEMVQESRLPAEYIQAGAVRNLSKAVGVVAREGIVGGEQVLERRLLMTGKQVGFNGVIPAGKRALTVAVSDVTGVAGLLKAGDSVDAIVTFDQQAVGSHVSRMVLQNLLVLAVNRESEVPAERDVKKDSKDAAVFKLATVTLAVSPEEATQMTLSEEKGKLRFALRPYLPETNVTMLPTVTPADIVGMQKPPTQTQAPTPAAAAPATGKPSAEAKGVSGVMTVRGTKIE
jgi:pilus assembly protein CpaB